MLAALPLALPRDAPRALRVEPTVEALLAAALGLVREDLEPRELRVDAELPGKKTARSL